MGLVAAHLNVSRNLLPRPVYVVLFPFLKV